MKPFLASLFLILFYIESISQTVSLQPGLNRTSIKYVKNSNLTTPCVIWTPDDWDPNSNKKYPVIIAYHGAEAAVNFNGVGAKPPQDLMVLMNNGILVTLNKGEKAQTFFGGQLVKFIVVAPQASSYTGDTSWLNPNINDLTKRLLLGIGGVVKMDSSRIYLTSYSAGGKPSIGNTCLSSSDSIYSSLIAATVPMSPATQDVNFGKLYLAAGRNIHFLSFTGALDPSYVLQMNRVQDTIQKHNNTLFPIADVMAGNGHCCWEQYWDTAFSIPGFGKNIYQWLLLWQRGSSNSPPLLNAGPNQTLILPSNSIILTGAATQGSSKIISTAWSELSGPSMALIDCASCLSTTVSNLVKGTYLFQLSATDSLGLTSFSATQIVVQVPSPPVVSSGGNQTLVFPINSATLLGLATKGGGGQIISSVWSQRSGPNIASIISPNSLSTAITGLISGNYVFRLTVSDSVGNSAYDSALVTVYSANGYTINVRVYAGANPYQNPVWNNWNLGIGIINNKSSGLLKYSDGTISPIGAILSYQDNLADNGSSYSSGAAICPDSVLRYSSYTTSARKLTLTGLNNSSKYNLEFYASRSRTDGQKTIFSTGTQQITVSTDKNSTNAAKFSAISPTNSQIVISINRGTTYNYLNGFKISVNIVNNPPVVNAGGNQTVNLPVNSVTLTGTAINGTNNIISTNWTQVSGPNSGTIINLGSLSTVVSGLIQGVYIFKLTATDSIGASSSSSTQVTVLPAPIPPFVTAGNNQTIAQPVNSVSLQGFDSVGSSKIISTTWSQVNGPGLSVISSPNSLNTIVYNLVQGIYTFKLTAIDTAGFSANSTVQVAVLPPTTPPTASAGANQTIILPVDTILLIGVATAGQSKIISTIWSLISGPGGDSILNPSSISTKVIDLVQGTYVFQLSATDSLGLVGNSTVQIIVQSPPLPKVNAGNNQSITIPVNSAILSAVDTAVSSRIVSNVWSQLSGPNNASILNPGSLTTTVIGLVQGTYVFQMMVSDSLNFTASAITQIIVQPPLPPKVYAGATQTITLPTNSILLSGIDTAGSSPIIATAWVLISGPNSDSILSPGSLTTTVTNLIQGIHLFQFSATDSMGLISRSIIEIIVRPGQGYVYKHIAVIGSSTAAGFFGSPPLWPHDSCWERQVFQHYQSQFLVDTSYNLAVISTNCFNGMPTWFIPLDTLPLSVYGVDSLHNITKAISDKPSAIIVGYPTNNYDFLTISQVLYALRTIKSSGDSAGIPTFILGTQPRGNLSASEHLKLIEINDSIRAEFGSRAILYYDSLASSPRSINMNPAFWLDGDSIHLNPTGQDIITRQILKSNFFAPHALVNAGNDQTVTYPVNAVILTGSVISGNSKIISTNWKFISGPPSVSIVNPGSLQTTVNNLLPGTYIFQLYVTDSLGLISSATTHILIKPSAIPIIHAGPNQSITLPVNSITLSGSDTAVSSPIVSTIWSLVSGPNSDSILSPGSLTTNVTNLIAGLYIFQLNATDSLGLVSSSITHVLVNSPPPPIVHAGPDQTITLPVNFILLSGSDSAVSNHIVSTIWSMLSGPKSDSILSPGSLTTTVTNLITGLYIFQLTATDSLGLVSSSITHVLVNPPAPPIVHAGSDQSITLPVNSVTLSGTDSRGSSPIVSTIWNLVNGPNSDSILSPGSLTTTVTNLIPGLYIFQLAATDSLGLGSSDITHVIVKSPVPPTANAGGKQLISLPINSILLSGIATAGSSRIVSIGWSQTGGPATAIISTPGDLTTQINNLIQGIYIFRLTIIDSLGYSSNDSAMVTVNAQSPSTINVRLYAGSVPFRNSQWNNWNVGTGVHINITSGIFNYSDGSSTTISAILSYEDNLADNGPSYLSGATMCPDTTLRFASYTTSPRTLTLTGLKNSTAYNLEFYASRSRTDGQKTVFAIGSQSITILTDNNSTNAAKFSNIIPSNGHITISLARVTTYSYFNGFKLTEINGNTISSNVGEILLQVPKINSEIKPFSPEFFPNPVSDHLYVLNKNNNSIQLQLFDISGRQLSIYRHISNSYDINIHPLARGTYVILATDERTKEIYRKIIIKY